MLTKTQHDFHKTLRDVGFRVTPARVAVLQILEKSEYPLSVNQIQTLLKKHQVDQATVYRIVNDFVEKGLAQAVRLHANHSSYEKVGKEHHHHIVCEKCGVISDVTCSIPHIERKAMEDSSFSKINSHSLEFLGLCKQCAK